jgi:hypothetical protein
MYGQSERSEKFCGQTVSEIVPLLVFYLVFYFLFYIELYLCTTSASPVYGHQCPLFMDTSVGGLHFNVGGLWTPVSEVYVTIGRPRFRF